MEKYFTGCKTREEASKKLKELSKKYHPDTENGYSVLSHLKNGVIMAEISEEYAVLKKKFKRQLENNAKKLEVFEWVRQKGLSGIETNHENIKKVTSEGITKILENFIPDDKKTLRKIAIGLITEEIADFDLVEFSRNMFEKAEKILKLNK